MNKEEKFLKMLETKKEIERLETEPFDDSIRGLNKRIDNYFRSEYLKRKFNDFLRELKKTVSSPPK